MVNLVLAEQVEGSEEAGRDPGSKIMGSMEDQLIQTRNVFLD